MRLLIDIGHPAHVHLFKNFAWEMQNRGHTILFTCREKEFEIFLLEKYGFSYTSFGKKYNSKFGKVLGMVQFDLKEFLAGLKFKPDIFFSHGSIYASHAAFLLRKPHISLEDTFNFEQIILYKPFTKVILTSDYDHPLKSEKVIRYSGYHELAYLHPYKFSPDRYVLKELNLKNDEKFVIIRFVSWKATHDSGHQGISFENKISAVRQFSKYARVFISSEHELPSELQQYKIPITPDKMHDAIAFSSLLFGESSTMAEEAAMLGVPSIYLFNNSTYYTKHLEIKYKLLYNFSETPEDQIEAIKNGIILISSSGIKQGWQQRRQKMLSEKINVTDFFVWFIENYPKSKKIMIENPDYQYRFK